LVKNGDPKFFWPLWPRVQLGIEKARILSFGYNAYFNGNRVSPGWGISNIAKDLLFGMKSAKDHKLNDISLGKVSN
jgi:hypothetical protein